MILNTVVIYLSALTVLGSALVLLLLRLRAPTWPTVEVFLIERARLEHELRRATALDMPEREVLALVERICVIEHHIRRCLAGQTS